MRFQKKQLKAADLSNLHFILMLQPSGVKPVKCQCCWGVTVGVFFSGQADR